MFPIKIVSLTIFFNFQFKFFYNLFCKFKVTIMSNFLILVNLASTSNDLIKKYIRPEIVEGSSCLKYNH